MPVELTPELLADLCDPRDPRLSPDGRWVAVVVGPATKREEHRVSAIWLADATGVLPARQITSGLTEDSHPRWSPDGRRLAFLSDRAKRGLKQAYVLTLRDDGDGPPGGEARALTDELGDVCDLEWLPGVGGQLVYLATDAEDEAEKERRERERDDAHVMGAFWPRARPVVLDVATGAARRIDLGERHVAAFAPAPDGKRFAAMLWPTPELDWFVAGGDLALVDVATGAATTICKPGFHGDNIVWSRAGDALFLVARQGPTGVSSEQLWMVAARADPTLRCLTADAPYCVQQIARPAQSDAMLVVVAEGIESALYVWDTEGGALERLGDVPAGFAGLTVSDDGATVALLGSLSDRPLDIYAGAPGGPLQRVTNFHAVLDDVALGPQEPFTWERGGLTLDGILIYPPGTGRADGPFPMLVSIHGGPYGRWPNAFQRGAFGRWLAAQGYLVFMPNPHGGQGHGNTFATAVLHTVGNEDYADIMAGVDRLIECGLADPERLGCGGWSQGGFMTAWIIGHTERFKSAVMGAGVSDWGMMIATSDLPSYELLMGGGNPFEGVGPHAFDAQSPISFVSRATTPTLIVHGEKDERVPLSQAIFFYRGLRRYGVPTELVIYPREPHGLQERQHHLDLFQRVAAWHRRWNPVEGQPLDRDGGTSWVGPATTPPLE